MNGFKIFSQKYSEYSKQKIKIKNKMGQTLSTDASFRDIDITDDSLKLFVYEGEKKELFFVPFSRFIDTFEDNIYDIFVLVIPYIREQKKDNEYDNDKTSNISNISKAEEIINSTHRKNVTLNDKPKITHFVQIVKSKFIRTTFNLCKGSIWLFITPGKAHEQPRIVELIKKSRLMNYATTSFIYPYQLFSGDIPRNVGEAFTSDTMRLKKKMINLSDVSSSMEKAVVVREESNGYSCDSVCRGLFISGEEVAANLELLKANNVTHIVNLSGSIQYFPNQFKYFSVQLQDNVFEDLKDDFWEAVEFSKDAIQNGGVVLAHCRKGISRSASLCIAFLMQDGKSFDEAYSIVKKAHPCVSVNPQFVSQIKSFFHKE